MAGTWSRLPSSSSGFSSADAEVPERPAKRKPFSNLMKRFTNSIKSSDQHDKSKKGGIPLTNSKHKKSNTVNGGVKNNPYPESGPLQKRGSSPASSANGQLSFATRTSRPHDDSGSYGSISNSALQGQTGSSKSGAPTLATNAGTIHSDAGQSKAPTTTTGGGAFSSVDGRGAGSTFSSPNQSAHSLTTTLTTIQSQSPGNALGHGASGQPNNQHLSNPVMFSHQYQYPTSPAPSTMTASAIPRHVAETLPNTYNSATANNLLSDNASILTLASSSKRRRRSMDTDASMRALAPNSVWGGSRESLPLSVLSGNAESGGGLHIASQSRPSLGGLASAERASIYSNQGIAAPVLASERNSYYSHKPAKDLADAKSLRSITNLDARSQFDGRSAYDAKSINDAKSMDVSSLRNYEGSVRSGAIGHNRNDSIPGGIGSPLVGPGLGVLNRHGSTSGALSGSRNSSDWHMTREDVDNEDARVREAQPG
ncbi:hypothetical protein LTR08_003467 [Meristemomyces frigidus]|nr:hypothetical protein LTR08_003467 [Meristemomyces frigidus]